MKTKHARRRLSIRLKPSDRKYLQGFLHHGRDSIRVYTRAEILILLDQGKTAKNISEVLGVNPNTVRQIGFRYKDEGLDSALHDRARPGAKRALSERQSQEIIAMVCSSAPAGRNRWSLNLIAEEAVKRKIVKRVGRETIRVLLQSHDLKPWREKNVVHWKAHGGILSKDGRSVGFIREAI